MIQSKREETTVLANLVAEAKSLKERGIKNYPPAFRNAVVKYYGDSKITLTSLSEALGLQYGTVRRWASGAGRKKPQVKIAPVFERAEKKEVPAPKPKEDKIKIEIEGVEVSAGAGDLAKLLKEMNKGG